MEINFRITNIESDKDFSKGIFAKAIFFCPENQKLMFTNEDYNVKTTCLNPELLEEIKDKRLEINDITIKMNKNIGYCNQRDNYLGFFGMSFSYFISRMISKDGRARTIMHKLDFNRELEQFSADKMKHKLYLSDENWIEYAFVHNSKLGIEICFNVRILKDDEEMIISLN